MVMSYQSRTARHVYWEARFDAAQARDRWRLMSTVFDHRYPDCDRLVERVVERTLFSFKTNKRIFSSVMAVQRLGQWQRLMPGLSGPPPHPLPRRPVERVDPPL